MKKILKTKTKTKKTTIKDHLKLAEATMERGLESSEEVWKR
jgi:hypothetical protein